MLSARLIGGKDIDAAYIAAIMSPINKAPTEESRLIPSAFAISGTVMEDVDMMDWDEAKEGKTGCLY